MAGGTLLWPSFKSNKVKLAYIANARVPSERANAVQTVHMCAAFARAGAEVTLYHPARRNLPDFENVDLWEYYGVPRTFARCLVPCVDLFHLSGGRAWLERPIFVLQTIAFALSLVRLIRRAPADVYYSRDPLVLALMVIGLPRECRRMYFEAHTFPTNRIASAFRRWTLKRIGGVVAISGALRALYLGLGLPPDRVIVAPDGVDISRFSPDRPKAEARAALGLPKDSRLIVYTGGLYAGRGLEELIAAVNNLNATLVVVGGKDEESVSRLKAYAAERGAANVRFEGHHPPTQVPLYLAAADVLAMPYSRRTVAPGGITTDWMSPLKMFEYMASGRPIVATDLPALREVLRDGENALLVPPDDAAALETGLKRLLADDPLAARIAAQARRDAEMYTWDRRARVIMEFTSS